MGMIAVLIMSATAFAVPDFEAIRAGYRSSDFLLLDRNGELLNEDRVDLRERRLSWVALSDVSPALIKAVVRSEDRRFFSHGGVDWRAIAVAAFDHFFRDGRRGGSTITMQVASLVNPALKDRHAERTLRRKARQIMAALALERAWRKDRILEAYLNLVGFRGELRGIAAVSRGLFGKAPSGLDAAESALIAALIPSPNAGPGTIGERAARLAAGVTANTDRAAICRFAMDRLSRPYDIRPAVSLSPHVAKRLRQREKAEILCTLQADLQRFSTEVLQVRIASLEGANVADGAVLIVENRTGEVLAYVGNTGKASSAPFVDGITARRQAGSTLKPFLYADAIDRRILTAASLIDDSPFDVTTSAGGIYQPENYDREFRGRVTARVALASSLNIPAVKTLSLVGVEAFVRRLKTLGFNDLEDEDFYGFSLALGSADITLWDLVNAYRCLADGGAAGPLRLTFDDGPAASRRIYSAAAAFIVSDILSDREARSTTFSLESPLATRFWSAVKTGTSKDMRDNWCIGYSRRYTVGVWVGNFSGAPMWNVSGITGAAPVWLDIMNHLHRDMASTAPDPPEGLGAGEVAIEQSGKWVPRREWFIAGTEPARLAHFSENRRPRILYPAADTILALDPDIPDDLQRVFFKASVKGKWILDGQHLGDASLVTWRPTSGKHDLLLLGHNESVSDRVGFEVR